MRVTGSQIYRRSGGTAGYDLKASVFNETSPPTSSSLRGSKSASWAAQLQVTPFRRSGVAPQKHNAQPERPYDEKHIPKEPKHHRAKIENKQYPYKHCKVTEYSRQLRGAKSSPTCREKSPTQRVVSRNTKAKGSDLAITQ
jgi:hypothetical protein